VSPPVGSASVSWPSRPTATAAASMFATGATISALTTAVAGIGGYSSSRRASSSRLITEISPSSRCIDALAATFSATRSANGAGT
jgi:hypothetical protein